MIHDVRYQQPDRLLYIAFSSFQGVAQATRKILFESLKLPI